MSIPDESWYRARFAEGRRLYAFDATRKGEGGERVPVCSLEEAVVTLAERARRVPADMVDPDGYPTSTGGGIPQGSDPERLTPVESAVEQRVFSRAELDQLDQALTVITTMLATSAPAASSARTRIIEANRVSDPKPSIGRTVAVCAEEGCDELAVPGGRGRCEADRKWLERHPDVRAVPREVIENRKRPQRTHDDSAA